MSRYAQNTGVSPARSREEIERVLRRYGAEGFGYGWEHGKAMIAFQIENRHVRFLIPMPHADDYMLTDTGRERCRNAVERMVEQGERQRWRALLLVIKAKLEAVKSEIATFDEEFLAHILMPNGQTVGQYVLPHVTSAYETGRMPRGLLPDLTQEK